MQLSKFYIILGVHLLYAQQMLAQNDSLDTNHQIFFYENGIKSSEGRLVDGKPVGLWKTYYENGQLKTEGHRENNMLEGPWYFYRESGKLERIINYKADVKNGVEDIFSAEGLLTERYNYVANKKEGKAFFYYADGTVSKELEFVNNKEEGKAIEYGTDGRIITFLAYKDGFLRTQEKVNRYSSKGEKIGKWIEFYSNSNRVKEEGNYSNGKRNGLFKIFDKKGHLDRIETYKNGVLQEDSAAEILDVKKELGQDGKIKSIGSYANGKKQGIFREYNSDGEIIASSVYKNDVKVGEGVITGSGKYIGSWKIYYPTGELRAEGEYEEGKKNGKWKYYFITGELEQKGNYKNNLPSGEWVWYFKNREIKRQEYYRKGREDGESIEYDEQNRIVNSGNYVDGLRTGSWFLTTGDYEEEGEYIDDEKNGKWKSIYKSNEQIYFEGEYSLGVPIKKHVYYFPNGLKKAEGKHQGGERHGDWKFYKEDGTIRLVIRYTNGIETRLNGEKL